MIIKKTIQVGNPIIRAKAKPLPDPTSKATAKIVTDLIDSMRYHRLVGMAAPQIGKSARIFVTEVRKTKYRKKKQLDKLRIFINPRIKSFSRKQIMDWEGCGSVASANLFGMVRRPTSVVIEAQNLEGERFQTKVTGLLARIIQHEMGHLNGKVFTDLADVGTYMSESEYLKMQTRKVKI